MRSSSFHPAVFALLFVSGLALLIAPVFTALGGDAATDRLKDLTGRAVSDDAAAAKAAITELRLAGPEGLRAILEANRDVIAHHAAAAAAAEPEASEDQAWQKVSSALDGVAGQKDAYSSGLYWYTDLD